MDSVQSSALLLISCGIMQVSSSLVLVYPSVQWREVHSRPDITQAVEGFRERLGGDRLKEK